ncbi:MAG: pyruvate, phosphate dikinase [Planctomycetes bacterium]|nr:pyruvate, phosphate dikinase [Planctomycetota bacterium]
MVVTQPSTGLPALDKILHGIRPGDNIVWQVDSIDDYLPFVKPFVAGAQNEGRKIVYFRFAKHKELVSKDSGVSIYHLNPAAGFEIFITKIHEVIAQTGRDTYYVFDSLSELAIECFSERMLGNFFRLTCPYLYELNTVAYFAVLRNYHSYHAALPISETTQLLLDIYKYEDKMYVYPLKVHGRHSSTMFMLHVWNDDEFTPVTESTTISNILTSAHWPGLQSASYRMVGMWDRRFMQAEELLESYNNGECSAQTVDKMFRRQLKQLISRDERILTIAQKYLTLSDLIYFWKHLIGSGMIGGKAVGMLLARAILRKNNPRLAALLEAVDSFFIGSDIFYSFLVVNGCWSIRQNQKHPATLFDGAEEARQRILEGNFPDYIVTRFSDMLNYFGQSPIIVRSSSLLEDNFGNAFSGKYESVFCINQGTHQKRLEEFMNAVRLIYASSMSEKALSYRSQRNVLEQDEQMALLVQRVSGKPYGKFFFPQLAGVGLSYNPYVWDESIDPIAGVLRLVFGLGTRAVNRFDDDYTRMVALNAPEKHPGVDFNEVARYSQKKVDILDLAEDSFTSSYFADVVKQSSELPVEWFVSFDRKLEQLLRHNKKNYTRPCVLTFNKIFSKTEFIKDMREMLKILKQAYDCHVDIEFTTNFLSDGIYRINLLQCRPLQIGEKVSIERPIPSIDKENRILETQSGIIGQSKTLSIDRLIYVEPSAYGNLDDRDRYTIARLIGKLTHIEENEEPKTVMLLGPGRWGTSTPSLGVPVSFAEINTVSVLCEIDTMREGLVADLSLGTHFFGDLVEMDMLYIGFFSQKKGNVLNKDFLSQSKNHLQEVLPQASAWIQVIRVIEASEEQKFILSADVMKQKAVVYIDKKRS